MSALQVGSFVVIHGLSKSPLFNGMTGMVVTASSRNEGGRWGVQLLDNAGDSATVWKTDAAKRCGGRVLAVREQNIRVSSRDSPHWQIKDLPGNLSVLELIRTDARLSRMTACDEFARALWAAFFETTPGLPLKFVPGNDWRKKIIGAAGHMMWYLELDGMMHHLIIEKCRGRYRIYQSNVINRNTGLGYSGGAWCTFGSFPSAMKAHKVYGGGLTFGDVEMTTYLGWTLEVQELVKTLTPSLLKHVEGLDASVIHLLAKGAIKMTARNQERRLKALEVASRWSNSVRLTGITVDAFADPVSILQVGSGKPLFEIPQALYRRARVLIENLTGQRQRILNSNVFVMMINKGLCWELRPNPDDVGEGWFVIREADFDRVIPYEEGIKAAKEVTKFVKRT